MTKEHILQFAVSIDEDRIVQMVEDRAVKAGVDNITKLVEQRNKARGYYDQSYIDKVINDRVSDLIKENKEIIIEKAANKLADRLVRTRVVKEKVAEVLDTTIG